MPESFVAPKTCHICHNYRFWKCAIADRHSQIIRKNILPYSPKKVSIKKFLTLFFGWTFYFDKMPLYFTKTNHIYKFYKQILSF